MRAAKIFTKNIVFKIVGKQERKPETDDSNVIRTVRMAVAVQRQARGCHTEAPPEVCEDGRKEAASQSCCHPHPPGENPRSALKQLTEKNLGSGGTLGLVQSTLCLRTHC
ncbi:uncharacterized protein LOC144580214 [Callithrix jacchus]